MYTDAELRQMQADARQAEADAVSAMNFCRAHPEGVTIVEPGDVNTPVTPPGGPVSGLRWMGHE